MSTLKEGYMLIKTPRRPEWIMRLSSAAVLSGLIASMIPLLAAPAQERASSSCSWRPVRRGVVRSLIHRESEIDLAEAALRLAPEGLSRSQRHDVISEIDDLSARLRDRVRAGDDPRSRVALLNEMLFVELGFLGVVSASAPEELSLASLMERRKGTCVSLVILYLALAERVGLEVSAAATPTHVYVRVVLPSGIINIETLEGGRAVQDSVYRSRMPMAEEGIASGAFLSPLSKLELLGHLVNNRGVVAASLGNPRAALSEYDAALEFHPTLNAAHYNRGLSNLALGRYGAAVEDFTRALAIHALDVQAYNNRGIAHLRLGNRPAAREDFTEALRIKPAMREARENLQRLNELDAVAPGENSTSGP
jgi:regulator of sirC expression with transglutaminase-like and TPR domain